MTEEHHNNNLTSPRNRGILATGKSIMADQAVEDFDGDIFIYRGGRAPQHITHARIDKSVDEIRDYAFEDCKHLVTVETHNGIRKIGRSAFRRCSSLRRINLKSAVEIDEHAFFCCDNLESVEFGDKLETIGSHAFVSCRSLTHLKLPSIISISALAFNHCTRLTDVEFSEHIETIGVLAFYYCERLQRIAIPLKRDLFEFSGPYQKYNQFDRCVRLTTVDIFGGINETIASLHMERWRAKMIAEIIRINQVLPNTSRREKTAVIKRWMDSVIDKMDHYKAEHCRYVKEGITLLELAVWKAKLDEKEEYNCEEGRTKKAKVDDESVRKESRMLCGADIVIKNVLPFLQLV